MFTRPPVPSEQAIIRRIRELRLAASWSQGELGRRMAGRGWPWYPQTVARAESGQRHLRIGELEELAAIFAVTPSALMGDLDVRDAAAARAALEREVRDRIAAEIAGRNRGDSGTSRAA